MQIAERIMPEMGSEVCVCVVCGVCGVCLWCVCGVFVVCVCAWEGEVAPVV